MTNLDLSDDSMCFACGRRNPDGLHLEFTDTENGLTTTIAFDERFQGYRDIVHGGLVSTVLDETMVPLLNRSGVLALTAELTVRFLAPVKVGEPITFTARLVESRRNIHRVEAEATHGSKIVARGEARFIAIGATARQKAS